MRTTRRGFLGALLAAPLVAAARLGTKEVRRVQWHGIGNDGRLVELDKEWQHATAQIGSGLAIPPEALLRPYKTDIDDRHVDYFPGLGDRPYKTDIAQMARDFGLPLARPRFPKGMLDRIVKVEPL